MNIYVLLKRTFDTEEKIIVSNGVISDENAQFVINPYDEYAVEEGIKLKEAHGGTVTVVCVGNNDCEKEIRTSLAMGADKAVLINVEDDVENRDQFTTAKVIAAYLAEQSPDIIIGGNVAIDNGTGQVGPRVAELLDIPCVTTITKIELEGTNVTVERDVEGDTEVITTTLPLLVTAQQGLNEPRYPSLPGIMKAKKKPLDELALDDLDLEEEDVESKTKTIEVYLPPKKDAGKVLQGELPAQVKELVGLLRTEAKVL